MHIFLTQLGGASGGGKYSNIWATSLETLCNKEKYESIIGKYGTKRFISLVVLNSEDMPLECINLDIFEIIFSPEEIRNMGWLLEFNSKATSIRGKYPIFRKEIYMKYGVDKAVRQ